MGIALVTGASAGLGTEFAKLFAADGHSVILVARRKDRLQQLSNELEAAHPGIATWVINLDLSQHGAGQMLFDHVQSLNLNVDYLVNNAGFGSGGRFAELDLSRELQMIDLNVRTLVETTRLFLPAMLKRRSGKILNVGSIAGFQPGPYMANYSATKAFVNSFSEALYEELRGTGVTCSLLAPGFTVTEFQQAAAIAGFPGADSPLSATALEVATTGYQTLMKGRATKVHGFMNWMGVQSQRLSPRFAVRQIAGKLIKSQL